MKEFAPQTIVPPAGELLYLPAVGDAGKMRNGSTKYTVEFVRIYHLHPDHIYLDVRGPKTQGYYTYDPPRAGKSMLRRLSDFYPTETTQTKAKKEQRWKGAQYSDLRTAESSKFKWLFRPAPIANIDKPETEKGNEMTVKLFSWKQGGKEYFGEQLATNRDGKLVLQIKGSEEVVVKSKDEVEKVIPYTVQITQLSASGPGGGSHKDIHCEEGTVKAGEVLMDGSGKLYRVTKMDTKCETPSTISGGWRKVVTEPLKT